MNISKRIERAEKIACSEQCETCKRFTLSKINLEVDLDGAVKVQTKCEHCGRQDVFTYRNLGA